MRTTGDTGAPAPSSVPSGALGDGAEECVARARQLVAAVGTLPHPGRGRTIERWQALAEVAHADLSIARIVEGHHDALAILGDLGAGPEPDGLLGVWAARPGELRAAPDDGGWILDGAKPYCSGADLLDAALVTATTDGGPMLFLVTPGDVEVVPGSWSPLGMAATRSATLRFDQVALAGTAAVGTPSAYVDRPGFGHGGCGVAACWWGGATRLLRDVGAVLHDDDLALVEFGRAAAGLDHVARFLGDAAAQFDRHPEDAALAAGLAVPVRAAAAEAAHEVLGLAARQLGTSVLGHDRTVAGRIADLTTYLTQHRPAAAVDVGRWHLAQPARPLC